MATTYHPLKKDMVRLVRLHKKLTSCADSKAGGALESDEASRKAVEAVDAVIGRKIAPNVHRPAGAPAQAVRKRVDTSGGRRDAGHVPRSGTSRTVAVGTEQEKEQPVKDIPWHRLVLSDPECRAYIKQHQSAGYAHHATLAAYNKDRKKRRQRKAILDSN